MEIRGAVRAEEVKDAFDYPAQFANFVSMVGNSEEVIFQFGQVRTNGQPDPLPIAKIAMSRKSAMEMLGFLNKFKDEAQDDQ